jgi:hypothetical protein
VRHPVIPNSINNMNERFSFHKTSTMLNRNVKDLGPIYVPSDVPRITTNFCSICFPRIICLFTTHVYSHEARNFHRRDLISPKHLFLLLFRAHFFFASVHMMKMYLPCCFSTFDEHPNDGNAIPTGSAPTQRNGCTANTVVMLGLSAKQSTSRTSPTRRKDKVRG